MLQHSGFKPLGPAGSQLGSRFQLAAISAGLQALPPRLAARAPPPARARPSHAHRARHQAQRACGARCAGRHGQWRPNQVKPPRLFACPRTRFASPAKRAVSASASSRSSPPARRRGHGGLDTRAQRVVFALGALAALSLRVRDASHLDIVVLLKNFNRTMYQIDLLPCFSLR